MNGKRGKGEGGRRRRRRVKVKEGKAREVSRGKLQIAGLERRKGRQKLCRELTAWANPIM
jgi:hypothetical protein